MIKTVIFDIGNVLAMADWPERFLEMGIEQDKIERVMKATVSSELWHEFDRGKMTDEELIQGFIQLDPPMESEILKIFSNLDKIVKVCDYAQAWVKSFHDRGMQTLVLSNFPKSAFLAVKDKFTFLDHTDGAVVSYMYHEIKPERAIYDRLISQYQVVPEEAVFIDDLKRNVDAAISYGYHGILFTGKEQADKEIELLCQKPQTRK